MMAQMPYKEALDADYINELLSKLGGKDVILTGTSFDACKTGAAIRENGNISYYFHDRYERSFHGTGDMFAACFVGAWLQTENLEKSIEIAAKYVSKSIENTAKNPAHWYGVKFETALPDLIRMLDI